MGKTGKRMWLGVSVAAAVVALTIGWLAVANLAQAGVSSLGIGSDTVAPGESVTLDLTAEATAPGIGAYGVNVVYDGSLVTATACTSTNGACTIGEVGVNTVRINGSSAAGLTGTVVLGTITFEAGASEGTANLDVQIDELVDRDGVDISVTPGDGTITIEEEEAPPEATPTPTVTVVAPPITGGSPGDGSGTAGWLLAGVIALGAVLIGSGVWATRRFRS